MNGLIAVEYYSAIGKEWKLAICDNMDGFRGYYVKWNKSEKGRYHVNSLICGIEKTKQMNKQNRNRVVYTEDKQVVAIGEGVWEGK